MVCKLYKHTHFNSPCLVHCVLCMPASLSLKSILIFFMLVCCLLFLQLRNSFRGLAFGEVGTTAIAEGLAENDRLSELRYATSMGLSVATLLVSACLLNRT